MIRENVLELGGRRSTSRTEILLLSSMIFVFFVKDFLHGMREKVWELDNEIHFKDRFCNCLL